VTDIDTPPHTADPVDTDLVMMLAGTDAIHFLQGQTTADFENAEAGAVRFAAFCNPKGRVIADVLAVIVSAEHVMMRGRQAVMTALAAHLKPYLSFSKSTLSQSDWRISCRTVDAAKPTPEHAAVVHYDADAIVRIEIPRGDDIIECWEASESGASSHATALLPLAAVDIMSARARVELDTMGAYLPQDLNYDLNGTVSFTKGCYTGQEIVARLHYRGTPKRRLYRALLNGTLDGTLDDTLDAIAPGARLSNATNRAVGSVVNRVSQGDLQQVLIELTPEAARDSVLLGEPTRALSAIQACYEEADQSTSPR
jgi:tRNA-modifying protein YgfZ